MGNTNRSSLPNSDGIPLFCGWEPLRWSGCLSVVPGISPPPTLEIAVEGGGRGERRWHRLRGLFRRAVHSARWASRVAQERSGMSDWISVRVHRRGSSGVGRPSGKKWGGRACLTSGASCGTIPLSAVLSSCFVECVMASCCMKMACWAGCFPRGLRWGELR